jgi:sporulation protein YlmC with PRC-barrel domain
MLQLAKSFTNIPVMSLRTTGLVAMAEQPIINPNNLKIEGWYCKDQFSKHTMILLSKDVRDIVPQGLAIDDYERLSEPEELVRLQEIINLQFELLGKHVITDHKRRLGKVSDYAVDTISFMVQKLYISQPVYKTLSGGQLSIDRSQILEITNQRIVVQDVDEKVGSPVTAIAGLS